MRIYDVSTALLQPAQATPQDVAGPAGDSIMCEPETLEASVAEVRDFKANIAASLSGSEKTPSRDIATAVPVPTSPVSTLPSSASQMEKSSVRWPDLTVRFPLFFLKHVHIAKCETITLYSFAAK